MAHYLIYWKPDTVESNRELDSINHTASGQYAKLRVGDILWIVSSPKKDQLTLVGRQKVDRIVSQEEAEEQFDEDLWDADYHVLCDDPEPTYFGDISDLAKRLRFEGKVDRLPDGFSGQHFQSMRKLNRAAEHFMDEVWKVVMT